MKITTRIIGRYVGISVEFEDKDVNIDLGLSTLDETKTMKQKLLNSIQDFEKCIDEIERRYPTEEWG